MLKCEINNCGGELIKDKFVQYDGYICNKCGKYTDLEKKDNNNAKNRCNS